MPRRADALARERRRARVVGALGVVVALLVPLWLWHDVIADVARTSGSAGATVAFVGWAPWTLMALGLLCAIPVLVHDLRDRHRRFYRRGAAAWSGWGVTLYLLGFLLATQVAQIHGLHS